MKRIFIALLVLVLIPGCKSKGNAETAGERVDEIVDNIKEGESPLKHKGPVEKLGESIDKMVEPDKKNDTK